MQEAGELRIGNHRLHRVEAGQETGQRGCGMRAVQDPHLAHAVGLEIVGPDHVQPGLAQPQPFLQRARALQHQQMERLGHDAERIAHAPLRFQPRCVPAGIARHDAVHQRVEHIDLPVEPAEERGPELPALRMRGHDALEGAAVLLDQLAGHDQQAAAGLAAQGAEAGVEQGRELRRKAQGRSVARRRFGQVDDPGLGGVRDDDLEPGAGGVADGTVPVGGGAEGVGDAADDAAVVDLAAVLRATQEHGVEHVLGREPFGEVVAHRLGDGDAPG